MLLRYLLNGWLLRCWLLRCLSLRCLSLRWLTSCCHLTSKFVVTWPTALNNETRSSHFSIRILCFNPHIWSIYRINHMFVDFHVSWFLVILKDIVINLMVSTLHRWKCMNTKKTCEFLSFARTYVFLQIDCKLICWIFKVSHFKYMLNWHPTIGNFRSTHETHTKLVWHTQFFHV